MSFHGHCPVCDAECVNVVNEDSEDDWIERVFICEGEPGHQVVVTFGWPSVDEVRDSDGEVVPEHEWGYA